MTLTEKTTQTHLTFDRQIGVLRPTHFLSKPWDNFLLSESGKQLQLLLRVLPEAWQTYVLGGALRNLRLADSRTPPADIDLVIARCPNSAALIQSLEQFSPSVNGFGGLNCRTVPNGLPMDVWRVEDHAVAEGTPRPQSIEELLPNCLTNLDAIALDPRTKVLYEYGFCDGDRYRELNLVGRPGVDSRFVVSQAAHLILMIHKYEGQFAVGDDVWHYLARLLSASGVQEVRSYLIHKLARRQAGRLTQRLHACDSILNRALQHTPK